jgi:spore coat polysaccharide biosynthesis protein SpsF
MGNYKTEQEEFWAGVFGNEYIGRNKDEGLLQSNVDFFKPILARTGQVSSVLEFGANIGMNLLALRELVQNLEVGGIEINDKAVEQLRTVKDVRVYQGSFFDYVPDRKWDLVLIKTVLIHIHPDMLGKVYRLLYESCAQYICIAEYYNPRPVEVTYRGNTGKLFKRDFAGELMDAFPDLRLVDYGFKYHRENKYYDDITWFLMEKVK